jgi:hypothetical protein
MGDITDSYFSPFQLIMLVNGQPFNVSTIRNFNQRRLRAGAGNCTLLPEFHPYDFLTVDTYGVSYTTVSFVMAYAAFSLALLCFTWQVFSVRIHTLHYLWR